MHTKSSRTCETFKNSEQRRIIKGQAKQTIKDNEIINISHKQSGTRLRLLSCTNRTIQCVMNIVYSTIRKYVSCVLVYRVCKLSRLNTKQLNALCFGRLKGSGPIYGLQSCPQSIAAFGPSQRHR